MEDTIQKQTKMKLWTSIGRVFRLMSSLICLLLELLVQRWWASLRFLSSRLAEEKIPTMCSKNKQRRMVQRYNGNSDLQEDAAKAAPKKSWYLILHSTIQGYT